MPLPSAYRPSTTPLENPRIRSTGIRSRGIRNTGIRNSWLPRAGGSGKSPSGMPAIIGHRGHPGAAPENTLSAFSAAAAAGAAAVECDLRLAAGGQAVILHDDTLDRTTDLTGPVAAAGACELARADAGSWFSPRFRGAPVPTVPDLLDWARDHPDVGLLLEFKGRWSAGEVAPVLSALRSSPAAGRTAVQSFCPDTLAVLAHAAPEIPRGLLLEALPPGGAAELEACLQRTGAAACNPGADLLSTTPGLVRVLHGWGMDVSVWTLDAEHQWRAALQAGVDAIITNRPDGLAAWESTRTRDWTAAPI